MLYLRQSTASQSVLLGPFVDSTDGATAETALTIANTDIRLSANGGNMFAKTSGGGTHDENGWYTITLDATDTATVGRIQISCKVAGALAVFMECQVLEENVYDALFASSAALGTDISSILTDTGTTLDGKIDTIDANVDAILVDTGTTLQAELDGIQADTEDIQTRLPAALVGGKMDSDATAISGDTTAADNLEKEYDGTGYGAVLQRTTIATLASQTSFTLTAGSADDDAYNGCIIVIEDASTAAQKAVGVISDYTGLTKTVTLLNDPGIFVMAATDVVTVIADKSLKPATDNQTLTVESDGQAHADVKEIEGVDATDQINAACDTALIDYDPPTGAELVSEINSVQTDVAAVQTTANAIETDTQDIQSRIPAALTANGNIKASVLEFLTTALTETAGQITAAFKKFFDVATPTGTVNSLPDAAPDAAGGLPISDAGGLDLDTVASNVAAILADTGTDGVKVAASQVEIKKNAVFANFMFVMTDSTNHVPTTSLTVTAQRSIDGAAFGACANAVTELASGVYKITLAAADLNGDTIMLRFTATGADDLLIQVVTQ